MFGFDDIKLALSGDSAASGRLVDAAKNAKGLVDTFTQLSGGTRSDAQPTPETNVQAAMASFTPSSLSSVGVGAAALVVVVVLALLWRE